MKLTLVIIELQMKSKKKALGVLNSNVKTYTRYSLIADEMQNKKFLVVLKGSFLSSLVEGGNCLFNFFKIGNL